MSISVCLLRRVFIFEVFEGVQVFPVDLRLQLFGDAVGELVVVFNPPPSLGVLDGHDGDACRDQRAARSHSAAGLLLNDARFSLTCNRGSQLLHQLDGGSHGSSGLDPLVHQQNPQACVDQQQTDRQTLTLLPLAEGDN